jgi:HEAT repeat protein
MSFDLKPLHEAITGTDPVAVREAIARVGSNLDKLDLSQIPDVVEIIASLFYIDLGDRPEYVHVVEEAVATIAAMGEHAVPTLMWLIGESDVKAQLMLGRTLGRIGAPAYGPLKNLYYQTQEPWHRALALFALAKMHEAALMEIFPDAVNALDDSNRELRDTAARTVGRIIDSFQPGQLPHDLVSNAFERLMLRLGDFNAVVRAKAVRTIGKMAKNHYLDREQLESARGAIESLLGLDNGESDPFFLVRREAQEALGYLKAEEQNWE